FPDRWIGRNGSVPRALALLGQDRRNMIAPLGTQTVKAVRCSLFEGCNDKRTVAYDLVFRVENGISFTNGEYVNLNTLSAGPASRRNMWSSD
ncbi:hypothetical protein WH47_04464, partial [Habropoda laboriosa]